MLYTKKKYLKHASNAETYKHSNRAASPKGEALHKRAGFFLQNIKVLEYVNSCGK